MKVNIKNKTSRGIGFRPVIAFAIWLLPALVEVASAHDLTGDPAHPHYDRSVRPPETAAPNWFLLAQADPRPSRIQAAGSAASDRKPIQANAFEAFAPRVKVRWDNSFLYIESGGLPAHNMMVGITAWQQQVPLPLKQQRWWWRLPPPRRWAPHTYSFHSSWCRAA